MQTVSTIQVSGIVHMCVVCAGYIMHACRPLQIDITGLDAASDKFIEQSVG